MRRQSATAACKIGAVVLSATAITSVALFRRWSHFVMPRRDPRIPFREFNLQTADGIILRVRRVPGGDRGAVIVAHPAVTGQRYAPLVDMVERLSAYFDVFTFDFRGHGRSGGRLELNLAGPLEDMRAVVSEVRSAGYPRVGVIGFSLGGMCAFLHAALYGGLDAVAVVGAPPLLPDVESYRRWLPAWSVFLRLMGARFKAVNPGGPLPMHEAGKFPDVPLLVIHGEKEAFYSRDDLEEMLRKLGGREEFWLIPGAAHTELGGREQDLVEWMAACSL